ncbi:MAG: A24 family peptidase, partial [bacterium]
MNTYINYILLLPIVKYVTSFLLGICLGSFLNVLIYRFPRELPVIWDRSQCPQCGEEVEWYDNIPLFSFLWLRGRCRHCGERISGRYFVVELLSGIVLLGCTIWWTEGGQTDYLNLAITAGFILVCLAISIVDFDFSIIPNELSYSMIALGLMAGWIPHYPIRQASSSWFSSDQFITALIGLILGGGIFLAIAVLSPLLYG